MKENVEKEGVLAQLGELMVLLDSDSGFQQFLSSKERRRRRW